MDSWNRAYKDPKIGALNSCKFVEFTCKRYLNKTKMAGKTMSPKYSGGFTLLELIVNVAIIGILIAIAIPAYFNFRDKGRIGQARTDLHNIQVAMELLATDTGQWPGHQQMDKTNTAGNNEIWDLSIRSAGLVATDGNYKNWRGPYIPSSITRDPWGMNYFLDTDYTYKGQLVAALGSFGPNKCCQNAYDSDDVILILPTQ